MSATHTDRKTEMLGRFREQYPDVQHLSHFYSLGTRYGRCMFACPPMGWSECEPFAVGAYGEEGSFFTGVVWFDEETGRFSDLQPHA